MDQNEATGIQSSVCPLDGPGRDPPLGVGSERAGEGERNTVGGWPFLDVGRAWPVCDCGERMVLFFHGLFLGNEVHIVACPERCNPAAAWPIAQN